MAKIAVPYKVELIDARLSFSQQLFKAKSFEEGQAAQYQSTFLLDPSITAHEEKIVEIEAAVNECIQDKWGKKISIESIKAGSLKPKKWKGFCFGDETDLDEVYDGWADMFWIRGSKKAEDGRVLVVDRDNSVLTAEDGKLYAGCYVQATLAFWAQDNKYGTRINANLRGVKFFRNGEAFGRAQATADDEFTDIDDEEMSDDFLND